jgi:hypothetical protein
MNLHSKIGRNFLLHSFFLLVIVAGLQGTGLFDEDVITYYNGNGVTYPTELVLGETSKKLSAASIFDKVIDRQHVIWTVIDQHFDSGTLLAAIGFVKDAGYKRRPYNSDLRSFYPFNITHQNSDEDEAPFLSSAIA